MTPELHVVDNILRQCPKESLWCADENIGGYTPDSFNGQILTNRFDIYQNLHKSFTHTTFNDFDFHAVTSPLEQIVFRIAKEKALNLHIIQQAFMHLQKGKQLFLIGYKNEGINSLGTYISEHFAVDINIHKYKAQLQCLEISSQQEPAQAESDNYSALQLVETDDIRFFSKPGVFGWNKLDKGSQLLIQNVEKPSANNKKQLLDLGCGYGYLAIKAKLMGFQQIDATDNNAAAILACQHNFKTLGIEGDVFPDNHAKHCRKKYNIILCNPPFHQGFDHNKNLTEVFVHQIHGLLKPHGEAYVVVNQFIGLEKIAALLFENWELLDKSGGFKVFLLKKS